MCGLPVSTTIVAQMHNTSLFDLLSEAIFVDGCHLYECVNSDLQIWLPKLSGAGKFSQLWP